MDRLSSTEHQKRIAGQGLLLLLATLYPSHVKAQTFKPPVRQDDKPAEPVPLPSDTGNTLDLQQLDSPQPEPTQDVPGTIVVEKFDFAGNTIFSREQLQSALADLIGKPISFADLVGAANAITELYTSSGYITSGAYIPVQSLDGQQVEIQILEGKTS